MQYRHTVAPVRKSVNWLVPQEVPNFAEIKTLQQTEFGIPLITVDTAALSTIVPTGRLKVWRISSKREHENFRTAYSGRPSGADSRENVSGAPL